MLRTALKPCQQYFKIFLTWWGDAFISVGLGGTDDQDTKLKKSKAIAEKALQRL
jgi:hypothetical protein